MYRIVQDPKLGEIKQLLLPATLKEKVITCLHDDMGHQGLERSLQLIRERYYWPKMYSNVEYWIKNCERCTLAKMSNPRIRVPMGSLLATKPLEILPIDFTVLEPGTDGRENVLVMTDVFTKFTCAVPTRYQKATSTAKVLVKEWFFKYGIQTKEETFKVRLLLNFADSMRLRRHELHRITLKEMHSVRDSTEQCMTC